MVVLSAFGGEDVAQIIEIDANRYLVRFGNTKLRVIDFSNPATPVVGATVTLGNNPWRIDRFGTREAWAALRIDTANANGGRDNVSVVLVQAAAGGKKRGLMSRWLRAS